MIVAGEPSGDLHASHVASKIKDLCPNVSLIGMGGNMMSDAGVELVYHIADSAVMGFSEILWNIPAFYKKLSHLCSIAIERKVDSLLLVDFAEFNVRLANYAHKHGIPTIYYIPPKVWAWRKYRSRKIARSTTVIASIFPFEAEFYRAAGANVEFVGHPLIDLIDRSIHKTEARKHLFQSQDLHCDRNLELDLGSNNPVIGLMPGSRKNEVERLLPILLETADRVHKAFRDAQFILPLAQGIPRKIIPKIDFIKVVEQEDKLDNSIVYRCMKACDFVIAASGTATLELAYTLTPMIIVYKVSLFTWIMYRSLVKVSYCGLPNLIARREISPEILQNRLTADRLTRVTLGFLNNPKILSTQRENLRKVVTQLGSQGAVEKTAKLVLKEAGVL